MPIDKKILKQRKRDELKAAGLKELRHVFLTEEEEAVVKPKVLRMLERMRKNAK